jgi:predicted site-specific integrase-resolvase
MIKPRRSRETERSDRKAVRCAIYTRKSTEEGLDQDFNSLDAQRESAEAYIRSQAHEGWRLVPTRYDDGGFSGGNLDRPALAALVRDIEAGKIDCVVVYKVDRLSRSLMDFSKLVEVFEAHGVSFVSVTQQFNTTHSMGRLTLNILLSFAQFEREIIGCMVPRSWRVRTGTSVCVPGTGPSSSSRCFKAEFVPRRHGAARRAGTNRYERVRTRHGSGMGFDFKPFTAPPAAVRGPSDVLPEHQERAHHRLGQREERLRAEQSTNPAPRDESIAEHDDRQQPRGDPDKRDDERRDLLGWTREERDQRQREHRHAAEQDEPLGCPIEVRVKPEQPEEWPRGHDQERRRHQSHHA